MNKYNLKSILCTLAVFLGSLAPQLSSSLNVIDPSLVRPLQSNMQNSIGAQGVLIDPNWVITSSRFLNAEYLMLRGNQYDIDFSLSPPQSLRAHYPIALHRLTKPVLESQPVHRHINRSSSTSNPLALMTGLHQSITSSPPLAHEINFDLPTLGASASIHIPQNSSVIQNHSQAQFSFSDGDLGSGLYVQNEAQLGHPLKLAGMLGKDTSNHFFLCNLTTPEIQNWINNTLTEYALKTFEEIAPEQGFKMILTASNLSPPTSQVSKGAIPLTPDWYIGPKDIEPENPIRVGNQLYPIQEAAINVGLQKIYHLEQIPTDPVNSIPLHPFSQPSGLKGKELYIFSAAEHRYYRAEIPFIPNAASITVKTRLPLHAQIPAGSSLIVRNPQSQMKIAGTISKSEADANFRTLTIDWIAPLSQRRINNEIIKLALKAPIQTITTTGTTSTTSTTGTNTSPTTSSTEQADWTVIAYLDAYETGLTRSTGMVLNSHNLINTIKNFLSAQGTQPTGNINFVFLLKDGYFTTEEGFVKHQKNGTASSHSAVNHGSSFDDPAVISQFINRTYTNFPAKRYAFMVHAHASGCTSLASNETKVYSDALTGKAVDLMILGSCYMQDIESAYQFRKSVKYYITGQATVWSDSIVMSEIFKRIFLNREKSNLELSKMMVDTMTDPSISPTRTRINEETTSAIDTSKLKPIIERLNQLGKMVTETSTNYTGSASTINLNSRFGLRSVHDNTFDLMRVIQSIRNNCYGDTSIQSKCDELLVLLNQAIVDFKKNSMAKDVAGLSITSRSNMFTHVDRYMNLDFYKDTRNWKF